MTRRAAFALVLSLIYLAPLSAADSSATERLMRVADCIRDAGDLKGAPREAFMNKCLGSDAGVVAASPVRKKTAAVIAPAAPAMSVPPVAPTAVDGLPPQERILGCATASKDMQGEARAAYLKECLAGRVQSPAIDAEQARRRAACASEARTQASVDERPAFIAACMGSGASVAQGAAEAARLPATRDDSEPRRRAACNVMARDRQGAERKAFIEACIAARPTEASPVAVTRQVPPLSTEERLIRSKRCAEEARAKIAEGGEVMAYMNACMARP